MHGTCNIYSVHAELPVNLSAETIKDNLLFTINNLMTKNSNTTKVANKNKI